MTILKEILREKHKEVAALKQQPLPENSSAQRVSRIADSFPAAGHLNIIAEIKRASPSKGAINLALDPVTQAKQYEAYGAGAISVLTDQTFFKGSMNDLRDVRKAVGLPILCKDFIIDPVQINHAKMNGANIILLIAAALSKERFTLLYDYATALGLEVLCEVHQVDELAIVLQQHAPIIGINNRNLHDFHVDLDVTKKLIPAIGDQAAVIISESGMKSAADAKAAAKYGANSILVGEALVKSGNLENTLGSFQVPLKTEEINHAR